MKKKGIDEIALLQDGATLVSFIWPAQNAELMEQLSSKNINVLAMDSVPRISRAQALDALSSMANIAGYRAVVEAAHEFGRFFTGQITAAGKVPPAKVLVAGAGVAGLAAIGAAGSLGAIVRAFDVRPEVKEQVESMGAEFLTVDFQEDSGSGDGYAKEMSDDFNKKAAELYAEQAKDVDIIITTALIPGRPAPKLITKEMVDSMKAGSVIVDLAAANGGNCEYTVKDQVIMTDNGVKIVGYTDMVGRLPTQSSQLYATNLVNLLKLLCKEKDGNINIDFEDVVLRGVTVIKEGEITWPAPPIQVSAQPQAKQAQPVKKEPKVEEPTSPTKKVDWSCCSRWRICLDCIGSTCCVPFSLYRVCSCVCGGLLRSLERNTCSAYATNVCNECYLGHYCGWSVVANRTRKRGCIIPILYCCIDCKYQYIWWFHRNQAYA